MKKAIYIILFMTLFTVSCNNKNELMSPQNKDIVFINEDGSEPDSVVRSWIKNNPELYKFTNPHSEFWVEENYINSKMKRVATSQPSISVTGYDIKTQINSSVGAFPYGVKCEPRISRYVSYVVIKYQYKKFITVPKGASVILPPDNIMSNFTPMGIKPGTINQYGYTLAFVSTDGINDTYYLITEGFEITHNASGQQVAPLDDPIYIPCKFIKPSNIVFKYQYSSIDW